MHERRDVVDLEQDLGVSRGVDELDKLDKYPFNVRNLLQIAIQAVLEAYKALVLGLVLVLKVDSNLVLLVLQSLDEVSESLVKISDLLTEQLVELLSSLLQQIEIVFCEPPRVHYHLAQICDILLHRIAHLLDWDHVMPVVLIVHASGTNCLRALLTEVLNTFVLMALARDHRYDRLACLIGHRQDGEQLEVGLEEFGSADIDNFLVANGARAVRGIVDNVIDAERADCVCTIRENSRDSILLVEGLGAPIASDDHPGWLPPLGVGQSLLKVCLWLTDNVINFLLLHLNLLILCNLFKNI